jgi:hypothetical protein
VHCFAAEYTQRIVSPAQFYNVHRINEEQFQALHEPSFHSDKIGRMPWRQVNVTFNIFLLLRLHLYVALRCFVTKPIIKIFVWHEIAHADPSRGKLPFPLSTGHIHLLRAGGRSKTAR